MSDLIQHIFQLAKEFSEFVYRKCTDRAAILWFILYYHQFKKNPLFEMFVVVSICAPHIHAKGDCTMCANTIYRRRAQRIIANLIAYTVGRLTTTHKLHTV